MIDERKLWIQQWIDGELDTEVAEEVEKLLQEDEVAFRYYQSLLTLRRGLQDLAQEWQPGREQVVTGADKVLTAVMTSSPRKRWWPAAVTLATMAASLLIAVTLFWTTTDQNPPAQKDKTLPTTTPTLATSQPLPAPPAEEELLPLFSGDSTFSMEEALEAELSLLSPDQEERRDSTEEVAGEFFDLDQQVDQLLGQKL